MSKTKTVGMWLLDQVIKSTKWCAGELTGYKHYSHGNRNNENSKDAIHEMMEAVGRQNFFEQVEELRQRGLITVEREGVTSIRKITLSMEQFDQLFVYEGIENPKLVNRERRQFLKEQMERTKVPWVLAYYQDLYEQLEKGRIPANVRDEKIFALINTLSALEKDTWKRKFSYDALHDSKEFEKDKVYENKLITILMRYSPLVDEGMTGEEILAEHKIVTYSQTLECKGNLIFQLGDKQVDTSAMIYGCVLNAQTLVHAEPIALKNVKKIITIENKANYEEKVYEADTLYIYVHGFPSPKERLFLEKAVKLVAPETKFYHWSDMDYGGIRIFLFLKEKMFPNIHPIFMDRAAYEKSLAEGHGIALTPEKRIKLEKINAGELEELKQCILKYGVEFEQEGLI